MKSLDELAAETEVPLVLADQDGFITRVNDCFTRVFGWTQAEIAGRPLTVLIPRHLHDAHHLGFSRFLATGQPTLLNLPLKLRAIAKDGHEFDAEHFIVAERRDGRWTFAATIRALP